MVTTDYMLFHGMGLRLTVLATEYWRAELCDITGLAKWELMDMGPARDGWSPVTYKGEQVGRVAEVHPPE